MLPAAQGHRAAEPRSEPRPAPLSTAGTSQSPVPLCWRSGGTLSKIGVSWGPPGQGDKVAPGISAPSLSWEGSGSKFADEETVGTRLPLRLCQPQSLSVPLANVLPASWASLHMRVLRGSCEEVLESVWPKARGVSRLPPHGLSRRPETTH